MEDEEIEENTYGIGTAYPVGMGPMGRKSHQYTLFQYSVQARLSVHIPAASAVCICLNSHVFHVVSLSTLIYEVKLSKRP